MLSDDDFKATIQNVPLIAIDFVILNDRQEMFVGQRRNRPAAGSFFAPGGRIRKGESLAEATKRISKTELGIELSQPNLTFLGHYDHIYVDDNFYGMPGVDTHYFVCAYAVGLNDVAILNVETAHKQHSDLKWVPLLDAMRDETIHPNTQKYACDLACRFI